MSASDPAIDQSEQRKHLGTLIRLHRQRLQPEAAGFATTARRRTTGLRRFHHPQHGDLVFEQLTLHPAVRSDLKLVMLLPSA